MQSFSSLHNVLTCVLTISGPCEMEYLLLPILLSSCLSLLDFQVSLHWRTIVALFNFFQLARLLISELVAVSAPQACDFSGEDLLVSFESVFVLAYSSYGFFKLLIDGLHIEDVLIHLCVGFRNESNFFPMDILISVGADRLVLPVQRCNFSVTTYLRSSFDPLEVFVGVVIS